MLLLTSTWEPFGLVLPEAMSCGLPVISFSGLKGPDSIITDGVDGFLVKDRDVENFARCICQLIEQPNLCQELGRNAKACSQRYAANHIMPMWIKMIESLSNK
jgi:glycosyltransferase involved in cell wall biosynthesis